MKTIAKNKITHLWLFMLLFVLNSCHSAYYRSLAETSMYDINFSQGKWFLNHVTVNGKALKDLSTLTEETLSLCLNDSLFLSYGKRKAAYNVPILNDENFKEQLSILKATNSVDYVIQVFGNVVANDIRAINIKSMDNEEESIASITIQVYNVEKQSLIYSRYTTGSIEIEDDQHEGVWEKTAKAILKKCLQKELKTFKKNGGCEK